MSQAQREEVRRDVFALRVAGSLGVGAPDHVTVAGADAERGAFMAPLPLTADADRPEPHTMEAFGPVSTVMGYRDAAHAIEVAARGRGSLAGSVVTADAPFARTVVRGLAPRHGRLLVLDREAASESTGHGSTLPMLVHGGPRARGGRHAQRLAPPSAHRHPSQPLASGGRRGASGRRFSTLSGPQDPYHGTKSNAAQCIGRTTRKWRASRVAIHEVLSRSARATTDASVAPRGKSPYFSTS